MRAIGAGGFKPAPFRAAREAASLCCRQTVLPLSRALHLLQYFGHFSPSVLPAALASFHSGEGGRRECESEQCRGDAEAVTHDQNPLLETIMGAGLGRQPAFDRKLQLTPS